ncbi:peptidylprolyl isomerase [Vallitalea sp.]|jgi:parvulin-like peptidyl-prolyl isomerase|uniref:peptidylprolyl isomerase n=1 Tax=Vallitalea sp. TaxID=1882829 RepID=UPI0025FEC06F|nr:peptidylprolyl isomerase [Vallitalea sp.]MCT4687295.1 peptidylprolyl isomerase [Vallitalea sp.]
MKNLKHFILGFVTATFLLATVIGVSASGLVKDITAKISYEIRTVLDGEEFSPKDTDGTELEPIIYNGRTYLPVRSLCNALGLSVGWQNNTKTIILSTKPNTNYEDTIVTINGENKITLGEINLYLAQIKAQYESYFGANVWEQTTEDGKSIAQIAKDNALSSVQSSNIIASVAKQKGLKLSNEQQKGIDTKVNKFMSTYNKEGASKNGITSEIVKKTMVNQKLVELLFNKIMENYTADEDKLNSILNKNIQYKGYQENGYEYYAKKVRARHILIKTVDASNQPLSESKKAEAKKEAEKILAKAKAGKDFVALAKEYSQDPGSKDNGGEYTFSRGKMVPEFEEAAFNLKPGEISKIVETVYGYHIIKLEEVIEPTEEDIKAIKEREAHIKEQAIEELKKQAFNKKVEEWIADYKIEINDKIWNNVKITELEL